MKRFVVAFTVLFLAAGAADAANGLRVVSAGPVGEVATLAEANEIRVVFSEPMVVLGKIPNPVTAPFFRIEPAVKGTFRWSGTTTLIFTPNPSLPFATQYTVTIDKSAKSVGGKTLDQEYRWTFTTPTIRLLSTDWYRKGGRADAPVVIALRFNQPVDPKTILPHLQLRTEAHAPPDVAIPEAGRARLQRLEPKALQAFEAKRAKAAAAAQSGDEPVFAFLATDWDKERFRPANTLVVLETKPGVPPETWIKVLIDDQVAQSARHARAGRVQSFIIELDPMLFVRGMECVAGCDPEWRNDIYFRTGPGLSFEAVRKAVTVTDITDPAKETVLKPKEVSRDYDFPSSSYSLDELGYTIQPARTYAVRVDPSLT
ncbi:MAG TPA: Ig-like domain-containing protein, partial [Thermoanaerobaculia bacterium]|nr:Ig-like domain-containing protein [Thermoanaerobaculia bacterium]